MNFFFQKQVLMAVLDVVKDTNDDVVVLVCEKNGRYFLPSGVVGKGESSFKAVERVFREKVHKGLPWLAALDVVDSSGNREVPFVNSQNTDMYASFVKVYPRDTSRKSYERDFRHRPYSAEHSKEIDKVGWVDITEIRRSKFPWIDGMKRKWHILDNELIRPVFAI